VPDQVPYDAPAGSELVFAVTSKQLPVGFATLDLTTVTGVTFVVALEGQPPPLPTWTGIVLASPAPTSGLIYVGYVMQGGEFGTREGRYYVRPTLTTSSSPIPVPVDPDWVDVLNPWLR
jgi:hypothetical protein